MSYTVVRMRNGKEERIKVNILDALRSGKPPKAKGKYVQCRRCNTVHLPGSKVLPIKKPEAEESKKDESAGKNEDKSFTDEEDKKLTQLKADETSWKQIAEALNKPADACKSRWKVINPANKNDNKNENKDDKKNEKKEENFWKDKAKPNKSAEKQDDQKADSEPAKLTKKQKKAAKAEAKKEESKPATSDKPEDKNETAATPVVRDESRKWEAAAAKHFDKTGERITSEQARQMVEEKK